MKNIKTQILSSALTLFNEKGISDTTLRTIAQETGISQGNLNYHYKTKGLLLEALYFQLVEKMDAMVLELGKNVVDFRLIKSTSEKTMEQMYEYRFLLLSFTKVMMENPAIRTHFSLLQQKRNEEFIQIFKLLAKNEFIREEEFEGEFRRLYERMNVFGDYWINDFVVFGSTKSIAYYTGLFLETLYPYLTPKGKIEYLRVI